MYVPFSYLHFICKRKWDEKNTGSKIKDLLSLFVCVETHLTPNMGGGDLHIYSQYGWVYKEYNQVYIEGANHG